MPQPTTASSPSSPTWKAPKGAGATLAKAARDRLLAREKAEKERRRAAAVERSRKRAKPLLDFVVDSYAKYDAGWVHRLVCRKLEEFSAAVARGESPRLMLFLPPRHGKSFISSERFPVWHLGHYPDHNIVVASHSQSLSNKFSRRARQVACTGQVRELFPELVISKERRAVSEWETTAGGSFKAVGIGAGLTGSGADILIIDDVVKDHVQADSETHRENAWEWYSSTGYTRLAPGGGILVILTRWNEDDLAGRILAQAEGDPDADQWEVIRFPAIAEEDEIDDDGTPLRKLGEALHPARYPVARLNKIRKSIMGRFWFALYQQRPTSADGDMFKRGWWEWYAKRPARFDRIIQSWDFTFDDTAGADYVVGLVVGVRDGEYYVLDMVRDRMDAPTAARAVETLSLKWPEARAKLIEKKANGAAVIKLLKRKVSGLIPIEPMGGKTQRAAAVSPDVESGNVFLPEGVAWIHDFVEELAQFPKGAHDDIVDALTQALIYLSGNKSATQKLNRILGRGKKEPA
jgi:predicted phage terminase large subunit-like protein